MGDRIKHKLAGQISKESVNTDFQMGISLEGRNKLLPTTDINRIVDSGEVFSDERQSSGCYRLLGTIKTLFTNVLFDVSSSTSTDNTWATFNQDLFRDQSAIANGL